MLRSHLIKDISDIGLRFSKPHGQHLWSLNWDKVCLALIGNGLSQEGFPTAWRTVEQHATRWGHSKLQELVWVLNRVLMIARWGLMGYWWDSHLQVWTEWECVSFTWTSSCSSFFTSSSPPMSSQLTWGTSAQVSLRADGLLWLSAHWGKDIKHISPQLHLQWQVFMSVS